MAACPYDGRRFNWSKPEISKEEINKNQHYLGNRLRKKGVMEKCTFCIQRSRVGKNPACVEACPTGARIFGNLLDPKSTIRWFLGAFVFTILAKVAISIEIGKLRLNIKQKSSL